MKKYILFIFSLTACISFAQLPKSLMNPVEEDNPYYDYAGSIYMSSRFKESSVIHEKSTTYDAKLRYNIHTDAIEHKSGSELFELKKNPTTHARIDDDYFYYCNFKNQRGLNREGYYILVELNDKYRIYKKLSLDIKDPSEQATVNIRVAETGKIVINTTYYVEENNIILELPMNKKEILAVFSDKQEELSQYIKKSKIRLRKEEDLIRFVARYNALKSSGSEPTQSLLSNLIQRR